MSPSLIHCFSYYFSILDLALVVFIHETSFSFSYSYFASQKQPGKDIRRVCRKFNIRVVFKSGQTLRSMLTKVKDTLPLGKQSNVVYRIPCSCGQVYIGETKRRLETRLKEHRDACERGMMEKSAVAEHAWENHHPIDWEETTVLDRGRGQELLLKEALHIQMTPSEERFNQDGGLEVPGLLDRCDEEAGREEQSSPTFDL